jgi:hypothetical protein
VKLVDIPRTKRRQMKFEMVDIESNSKTKNIRDCVWFTSLDKTLKRVRRVI